MPDSNTAFIESFTKVISQEPSFPTIASLLELMQDAGEIYSKSNDTGRGKRTQLYRYVKEINVDLDKFPQVRDEVFNGWNELLEGLGSHWLDISRWFQVIDAYATMVRNVSCLGVRQSTISTCVVWTVTSWFTISLFRWHRDFKDYSKTLTNSNPLWFLGEPEKETPYITLFTELKNNLGIKFESYFALANTLLPEESKEKRDELAKMISDWCSGKLNPKLQTLREHIEKPLQEIGRLDLAKSFRSWILEVSFIRALYSWGDKIGASNLNIVIRESMQRTMNALVKDNSDLVFIPSSRFMYKADEYFRTVFQNDFWNGVENTKEQFKAVEFSKSINEIIKTIVSEILNPEVKPPEAIDLERLSLPLRYRFGPGYSALEDLAMQIAINSSDISMIKKIHSRRSLEQLVLTPYSTSKPWYKYIDSLRTGEVSPVSRLDYMDTILWAKKYRRKDRINQWRVIGRYRRTRLMIACIYGDMPLVEKLIVDGADPTLVSDFAGKDRGDGSTALLLALQSTYSNFANSNRTGCKEAALRVLDEIGRDEKTVNQATFIQNINPFYVAIVNGDPGMVSTLIHAGAFLERGIGGDELGPLYLSISELFINSIYTRFGKAGFLDWANKHGPDVNPNRMILPIFEMAASTRRTSPENLYSALPLGALQFLGSAIDTQFGNAPQRMEGLYSVIETLLEAGANPNRLQSNGRYPLDMADELGENIKDTTIRRLLEKHGAVKRSM